MHEVALAGTHSVTVGADIMLKLARHPLTDMSVEQFTKDWTAQYGDVKCIYNM